MTEFLVFGVIVIVIYLHSILKALERQRADEIDRQDRIDGAREAHAHLDAICRGDNPPYFGS